MSSASPGLSGCDGLSPRCCGHFECPYKDGVCCPNGRHCCPSDSKCMPVSSRDEQPMCAHVAAPAAPCVITCTAAPQCAHPPCTPSQRVGDCQCLAPPAPPSIGASAHLSLSDSSCSCPPAPPCSAQVGPCPPPPKCPCGQKSNTRGLQEAEEKPRKKAAADAEASKNDGVGKNKCLPSRPCQPEWRGEPSRESSSSSDQADQPDEIDDSNMKPAVVVKKGRLGMQDREGVFKATLTRAPNKEYAETNPYARDGAPTNWHN